jgi:hypothetical protein
MLLRSAAVAALCTLVLSTTACGEVTELRSKDCPGGWFTTADTARAPGPGGSTPEEAAEIFGSGVIQRKKATGLPSKVTGGRGETRLLYRDSSGKVVVQFDVTQDKSGWHVDTASYC